MQNLLLFFIFFIFLVFCWIIFVYNALVAGRNGIKNAEACMDVQLRKRYDLVPNLVATVKGYADHEKTVFERVTQLRQLAMQSSNPHQKNQADEALNTSLKHLFAIAEKYPDLKANEIFLQLQAALNEIEAQLAAARRTYNATVTQYNNTVQSFPSSMVAGMFGFAAHRWFEIAAEARQAPQMAGKF